MSFLKPSSRAEASDSLAILTATGTGLASLVYFAKVMEAYTGSPVSSWLDTAQLIGGLAVLVVLLPLFYHLKTGFGGAAVDPWKGDEFFGTVLRRAALTAFCAMMLGMILLTLLGDHLLSQVAAPVLLDGMIACALLVFSLSFFLLGRVEHGAGNP